MGEEVDWNAILKRLENAVLESNKNFDKKPFNYYYGNEEQLRQIKELTDEIEASIKDS